ncbi:MAG TPA: DUF885 domain-containing protein [Myxococcales bacterium]|nr:DUF885 domain-containing protein [Myxococcales bacterium]
MLSPAAFVLVSALAAAPADPGPLAPLRTAYLDGLFRAKPHLASYMGDHRFDDKVVDLSPAAQKKRVAELDAQEKKLRALDAKALSVDDQIDLQVMLDGIALERLYLTEIKEWKWSPRLNDSFPFYDPREIVAGRLSDLIHGTFASEEARRKSVVGQLKASPILFSQARGEVENPAPVHLEQAIKDNKGRIEFFNTELKAFTEKDPQAEKARVAALAAVVDYQKFLEAYPKAKATRDYRLGDAVYRKKFPVALQTELSPDEVVKRAEADFQKARADLLALAKKLHQQLWPKEPVPEGNPAALMNKVRDEIAKDHPRAEELVQAHARNLDRLRAFIEKNDLIVLPPASTLSVLPMPEFKRGAAGAEYLAPGMLDKSAPWHGTYYVDPVDPTWPPDKVESYLRANNNYSVELTAAHEAYPGHHTQAWWALKDLNPLRATLWNGAMAEGWAVYGEQQLVNLGYGGDKSSRYLFNRLKGAMIVAANAVLDVKLQTGQLTDEQALKYLVEDCLQEQALAEKKLHRAKLDSTQLVQYYLGYAEIRDLDLQAWKAWGAQYNQRRFNQLMVGHGSVAVRFLKRFVAASPGLDQPPAPGAPAPAPH